MQTSDVEETLAKITEGSEIRKGRNSTRNKQVLISFHCFM
jgi:hypothetical protein